MNINMTQATLPNFMDLLLDAVCLVDAEGHFVYVSPSCERVFGYTQQEMIGSRMYEFILPADVEKTRQAANEVLAGHYKTHFENRYVHKDGHIVHLMWSARWSDKDKLRIAVARDITERKHTEHMQRALYIISEAANTCEDLSHLFEQVYNVINEYTPAANFFVALHDEDRGILSFPFVRSEKQKMVEQLQGASLTAEVARTGNVVLLTPNARTASNDSAQWSDVDENTRYCLAYPLKVQNKLLGSLVLVSTCEKTNYSEKDQELLQLVANQVATIIERNKMQARFRYMAQYDQLTGLPNRVLLHDRLKTALERARRQEKKLAVLFLDLDKFKQVNDNFGHLAGDHLLQAIAIRLRECIRESDTIARIGGDEFAILLEGAQTLEQADRISEKIRTSLNQPLNYEGKALSISVSIGIAFYPDHGADERQLINHADRSMYATKPH